jgi:Cdc6-like AAA superfamily ATPase
MRAFPVTLQPNNRKETFASVQCRTIFAPRLKEVIPTNIVVTVAQLDRALDYGSRGLGFDSLR